MRLASAISGVACAMQRHAATRPYFACAILESVSPRSTVTSRSDFKLETVAGSTISVPAAMCVGSTMQGLAASSSCQREPRPRFCCASFQRESPGWTMTVCGGEAVLSRATGGAIEAAAFDFGADGAIAGAAVGGWAEGATETAAFGRGAEGAIRATDGGAGAAERRVKGSMRRRGAALALGIVGATTGAR